MERIKPLLAVKSSHYLNNYRCCCCLVLYFPCAFYDSTPAPTLTVAIVKEVSDGCRGAAAPGFGGIDGGKDGGHKPLIAVHSKTLLTEFGVVMWQTEQVTWGKGRRDLFTVRLWLHGVQRLLEEREKWRVLSQVSTCTRMRKENIKTLRCHVYDNRQYSRDINQPERCADWCANACSGVSVCVSMPTYLMRDSKRSMKPVILDNSTTSLWRADRANVRHSQCVAGVVATEVLDRGNTASLILHTNLKKLTLKKWFHPDTCETICHISR